MRLDLLLINPPSRKRVYQSLADRFAAIEPPVWAGLMAGFVRKRGCSVEILDGEALGLSTEETAALAAARHPVLAAVVAYGQQPSASTQVMPAAGAVCRRLKEASPELPVLLLGGHVAALPRRTLEEEAADFVAGGEGLETLVELVGALNARETDFAKVSDLYWRRDGRIQPPERRAALVQDLDVNLPGMAWDLLPMDQYRAHNWHCLGTVDGSGNLDRTPYASVYTSLGCPFHCSFCCIQAPFKAGEEARGMKAGTNSYRLWSPRRVVDGLECLARDHGVRNVKFADELFVLNPGHVEGICDGIVERGLDLNIWAYARVDTIKPALLSRMKQAGINWLALGIESANSQVRQDVDKGYPQSQIRSAMEQIRAAGISVIGNYIFGLPEDTRDSMEETLQMAMELQCEFANFYCAMAYPGSRLFDLASEQGWRLPDSWEGYSQHAYETLPLSTRHVSGEQVLAFRDEAFLRYFTDPSYLAMVERRFGAETLAHMKDMTSRRLRRKYLQPDLA